jgi:hypothetical protein
MRPAVGEGSFYRRNVEVTSKKTLPKWQLNIGIERALPVGKAFLRTCVHSWVPFPHDLLQAHPNEHWLEGASL